MQTIPPGQIDQRYEEIIQMMSDFKNSLSQKIHMFQESKQHLLADVNMLEKKKMETNAFLAELKVRELK